MAQIFDLAVGVLSFVATMILVGGGLVVAGAVVDDVLSARPTQVATRVATRMMRALDQ